MHSHFGRDVRVFFLNQPLHANMLFFFWSDYLKCFGNSSNFHYHSGQKPVRDFFVLMERNATLAMHFELGDATHGHTWPCVRTRRTGRG